MGEWHVAVVVAAAAITSIERPIRQALLKATGHVLSLTIKPPGSHLTGYYYRRQPDINLLTGDCSLYKGSVDLEHYE